MQRRQLITAAAAATALAPLPGRAQTAAWPQRPIRLVVGFAAGGGTDIVARALAPRMSELLGQQVVVENRAGAAGTIAADQVAKAPADGYTLLMGHSNSNAIAPYVLARVPYDPARDFSTITYVGYVPNVLVVHPSVPAQSVAELVALARARPGTLTYASSGVGSTQHLAGALFARIAGIELNHIPYKGSGQAVVDLLAGQVNMNFDTLPPVLEHIKAGRLRALAISTPQRLAQLPEVPAFDEVGIRGFDVTNWYSVMGPRNLPAELVTRVNDTLQRILHEPAMQSRLAGQGVQFNGPRTPDEFAAFVRAELAKYARLTRELGVKPE